MECSDVVHDDYIPTMIEIHFLISIIVLMPLQKHTSMIIILFE